MILSLLSLTFFLHAASAADPLDSRYTDNPNLAYIELRHDPDKLQAYIDICDFGPYLRKEKLVPKFLLQAFKEYARVYDDVGAALESLAKSKLTLETIAQNTAAVSAGTFEIKQKMGSSADAYYRGIDQQDQASAQAIEQEIEEVINLFDKLIASIEAKNQTMQKDHANLQERLRKQERSMLGAFVDWAFWGPKLRGNPNLLSVDDVRTLKKSYLDAKTDEKKRINASREQTRALIDSTKALVGDVAKTTISS